MIGEAARFLARTLSPERLTGPIFDKELRVSSRRRRNYLLRSCYLAALTLLIGLMWLAEVRPTLRHAQSIHLIAAMSEAAKIITACIVWFQFVASQVLAAILLSNSVSDEIYHRTLGTLVSTPITGLQIVLGKLASKMLQIVILLAISLPLLAIVRIFGGVPWDFVVSSLATTLVAALFAGTASLFFSIGSRRAYVVILKVLVAGGIVYALLPWVFYEVVHHQISEREFVSAVSHANPFFAMAIATEGMISSFGRRYSYSWPLGCAIGLAASGALLAWSAVRVRKAALRQASGAPAARSWFRRREPEVAPANDVAAGRIRPVHGCPVVWKELRAPLVRSRRWLAVIVVGTLLILLVTYGLCAQEDALHYGDAHIVYGLVFVVLGTLATAVLSATSITTEKESQSWPILLLTPLSEARIVWGKALGVVRRVLPVWALLYLHLVAFALAGIIHPVTILHLTILVAWIVTFLTCTGLYFGSRLRRTTTAVVANLCLIVALWVVVPFVSITLEKVIRDHSRCGLSEWLVNGNPAVQVVVAMENTTGWSYYNPNAAYAQVRETRYDWPDRSDLDFYSTTSRFLGWAVVYVIAGLILARRACSRIRQKVI